MIYGDVRIGAHCLFSLHTFVTSTSHRFRDRPEWLIRDQDEYFARFPAGAVDLPSRRVQIEEDCLFGWCAVVLPGVYIGRGAVIGANCVVTSDVAPYEVHAGVPNRKLFDRLIFQPPARIEAGEDSSIPYFYRGFVLGREALRRSREAGIVEARRKACIVLGVADTVRVRLKGQQPSAVDGLLLRVRINSRDAGEHLLGPGKFDLIVTGEGRRHNGDAAVPVALGKCTYVELETVSPSLDRPGLGIGTAELC